MFRSRIAVAAIALVTAIPGIALAHDREGRGAGRDTGCEGVTEAQRADGPVLAEYRILSVTPYNVEQTRIKTTWKEIRGAVVRVEAQPGLTAQWLQLQLGRHVAAVRSGAEPTSGGPLSVPGVQVSVSPAGDGFFVTLAATDKQNGEEILRRAEALKSSQR